MTAHFSLPCEDRMRLRANDIMLFEAVWLEEDWRVREWCSQYVAGPHPATAHPATGGA